MSDAKAGTSVQDPSPTPERSKPIEWWTLGSVCAIGIVNLVVASLNRTTIEKPRLKLETESHAAQQAALKEQRPIIKAETFDTGTTVELGDITCSARSVYVDIRNESDAPCDVEDITLRVFYCDRRKATRIAALPTEGRATESGVQPSPIVAVLDHRDTDGWIELPALRTVSPFSSGPILKGQSRRETFHVLLADFHALLKYEVDVAMKGIEPEHISWVGLNPTALCYPVPTGPVGGYYTAPAVEQAPEPPAAPAGL